MKYVLFLLFIIFTGCTASKPFTPKKPFDKVVILNQSNQTIQEAAIYSKSNHRKMQCGQLVEQAHCSYKFHRKQGTQNSFKISWRIDNKTYSHDNITLSKLKIKEGEPVSISINILNDGKFLINQL